MLVILGRVLEFLAWAGLLWLVVVGGSFSAVYLMGFLGTGGREAGSELVFALGITLPGIAVLYALARAGRWLATRDSRFEA